MARYAFVIPCQDVRFEFDGKLTLVGMFTSNIGIPAAPTVIPQLSFLVLIEGDLSEYLQSLKIEILLPGTPEPTKLEVPVPPIPQPMPLEGQSKWRFQMPIILANVVLYPGRIVFRIIHDQGELEVGARWVVIGQPTMPPGTISSILPPLPAAQSPPDASPKV
jgi:hypothetical protein